MSRNDLFDIIIWGGVGGGVQTALENSSVHCNVSVPQEIGRCKIFQRICNLLPWLSRPDPCDIVSCRLSKQTAWTSSAVEPRSGAFICLAATRGERSYAATFICCWSW